MQRWEQREGLPVHRHWHERLASIHAYVDELEAWRTSRVRSGGGETDAAIDPAAAAIAAAPAAHGGTPRGRLVLGVAGVLLGLAAVGILVAGRRPAGADAPIRSLAVLPFENLSGDASQDWLADGMTDAVIGSIARLPELSVVARTSVLQFEGTTLPAREIAEQLGVDALIEGSVLRSGSRLRVNVQLIAAASQAHLWSGTFQREMGDVLALQDDIARSVAGETRTRVRAGHGEVHPTLVPEAWEAYARGRVLWGRRRQPFTDMAREHFARALRLDPGFAEAHAALAETYAGGGARQIREGVQLAERAVELDSDLASAHAALGALALHDFRWTDARTSLERALELAPGDPAARFWHAHYLQAIGCADEAVAELKIARRLDPVGAVTGQALGTAQFLARDYLGAEDTLEQVLELEPDFFWASLRLGQSRGMAGDLAGAEAVMRPVPGSGLRLAHLLALHGRTEEARAMLATAERDATVPSVDRAAVHAALGEIEVAMAMLGDVWAARDQNLLHAKLDPRLDPLRSDPRFEMLLREMGLSPQLPCRR